MLFKNEIDPTEKAESQVTTVFGVGQNWTTSWRCYLVDTDETTNSFNFYNGVALRYSITNGGAPTYRGQVVIPIINMALHGGPIVQNPDGSSDLYGLRYWDGTKTRYFLTARQDPFGNTTTFSYVTNSGTICLDHVTDPDNNVTTLTYTNINSMWLVSSVTDPFGRSVSLVYDDFTYPHLIGITDAIGLSSSFQYDVFDDLTQLVTPYATNTFSGLVELDNQGFAITKAMKVQEAGVHSGIRNHLFIYVDSGDTSVMPSSFDAWRPSTTNGTAFSLANTFDSENSNLRNSFYWNPVQYELLPTAFIQNLTNGTLDTAGLYATNYLQARMRHWLLSTNAATAQAALGLTLSLQREPSPDSVTQGEITWYDYDNKLNGDPEWEGTMMLPRYEAWKLPNGQSRFFWYQRNALGKLTNVVETWNDTAGNLLLRTNIFVYATNNVDLVAVTNALGIRSQFNMFNSSHQVTTNYNALNELTVYTYDGLGRLSSVTRPNGLVTTNIYGLDGYLAQTVNIGFHTNSYTWANALVLTHTDERGLTTTNTCDNLNRLIKIAYPDGTCVTNAYANLDLVMAIDRMGFTNRYDYNDFRQVVHSIDALNRTNTFTYCDCGVLSSITDPLNGTTSFFYDLWGERISTFYPDGTWVSNRFDLMGRLTNVLDSAGTSTTNWYNNQAGLLTVSNAFGRVLVMACDVLNRLINSIDANGVSVETSYDSLNRIRSRSYPDGGIESFGYTMNISGRTSYTNQLNQVTRYGFDLENRKIAETNANLEVTQFSFNPAGDLLSLTDGKNQTTSWKYDQYGRVTNKVDATSTAILAYAYDPDNRLTNRVSAAKGTTVYRYDAVGNLTNVVYQISPAITLKYDGLNRLTNMIDAVGTTVYGYDAASQLLTEDGPWVDDTVTYTYQNRLPTRMSLFAPNTSAWTESYGYDSARRLTNVVSPAGSFSYALGGTSSASSLMRKLTFPSGAYITNEYDSNARLLSTVLNNSSDAALNVHTYLNNQGNQRTQQTFTEGNYMSYGYDNIGQVISAVGKESGGATNRLQEQLSYGYDAAHNLNWRTNSALVENFGVNNLNELTTVARTNRLTVAGTTTSPATNVTVNSSTASLYADSTFALGGFSLVNGTNTFTAIATDSYGRKDTNTIAVYLPATNNYTYDANGNLLSDGTRCFAYDDENQLISVWVTNAWQSDFVYDGKMRRRVRREYTWNSSTWVKTNEVHYVYDGNLVVQERDMNNLPQVSYTRGTDLSGSLQGAGGIGGLLARTELPTLNLQPSAAHAYYHADGIGNVTCLINTNQVVVARYEYDPFGNTLSASGSLADANPYRLSSKEFHVNSGLAYYLYRFYDPNLQRWLNRDPIEERGGINLYVFSHNGPIDWIDANGLYSTIACDGNGNYEVVLGDIDSASPSKKCIEQHERDHIKDWEKRYGKDSCKGKKRGELPSGDLPGEAPGSYDKFVRQSECDAYKNELKCDQELLKTCPSKDKPGVDDEIANDKAQIDAYCDKPKKPNPK